MSVISPATAKSATQGIRRRFMTWLRMKSDASGFRGKESGKAQCSFLLPLNKWGEQLLVSGKGLSVVTFASMQLACEDISRHHGQGGPLARKQRNAGSRIADQGHASLRPQSRPCVHAYLAYPVEIQFVGWHLRLAVSADIPSRYLRNASAGGPFAPGCRPCRRCRRQM